MYSILKSFPPSSQDKIL